MDKTVYILMATYNGDKFIKEQIESILNQTYQNWKLIIHDDNSKDNTVKIIKEYIYKYPEKIVFIDDKISTGGAKENFTYLLNKIDDNYDYVMFCDQDDVWIENKIELTLNKMIEVEKENIDKPVIIHTDLKVVDESLKTISESFFTYQNIKPEWSKDLYISLVQNSVTGCTMMINKKAKEVSLPIGNNAIMHDWWILLKVLQNKGIVDFINEPIILYRQHSSNDTGAKGFSLFKVLLKISSIQKYQKMSNELGIHLSLVQILYMKLKRLL
jgi:glycosyltransferase involved in cell wall biosynthesis